MAVSRTRLFADELVAWLLPHLSTPDKQDTERRLELKLDAWLRREAERLKQKIFDEHPELSE
jgi:hypothetical protein